MWQNKNKSQIVKTNCDQTQKLKLWTNSQKKLWQNSKLKLGQNPTTQIEEEKPREKIKCDKTEHKI